MEWWVFQLAMCQHEVGNPFKNLSSWSLLSAKHHSIRCCEIYIYLSHSCPGFFQALTRDPIILSSQWSSTNPNHIGITCITIGDFFIFFTHWDLLNLLSLACDDDIMAAKLGIGQLAMNPVVNFPQLGILIWLMVGPPLWKIWLRQVGWLATPIYGKIKNGNQTTNQLCIAWSFWIPKIKIGKGNASSGFYLRTSVGYGAVHDKLHILRGMMLLNSRL